MGVNGVREGEGDHQGVAGFGPQKGSIREDALFLLGGRMDDLIKRSWFGMPNDPLSGDQLYEDLFTIATEKKRAFESWLSQSDINLSDFGEVSSFARDQLHTLFSGFPVSENNVFRGGSAFNPNDWNAWTQFASSVDWSSPMPSIFSDQGPLQDAGRLAAQRLKEHIGLQVMEFPGLGNYPSVDPGEAVGVAYLGATDRVSQFIGQRHNLTPFAIQQDPSRAVRSLNAAIEWGMKNALQGEAMGMSANESYMFSTQLPSDLQNNINDPASSLFPKWGELTTEQTNTINYLTENYLGVPADYSVGHAHELYQLYERAEYQGINNLPDDMRALVRSNTSMPGGLELEMQQVGRRLVRNPLVASPEIRKWAREVTQDPEFTAEKYWETLYSNDPYAPQVQPGLQGRNYKQIHEDRVAEWATDYRFTPATERDIQQSARVRGEIIGDPVPPPSRTLQRTVDVTPIGQLEGPGAQYNFAQAREWAAANQLQPGQAMSATDRRRLNTEEQMVMAYRNRGELVRQHPGADPALIQYIEEMDINEFENYISGVQGRMFREQRVPVGRADLDETQLGTDRFDRARGAVDQLVGGMNFGGGGKPPAPPATEFPEPEKRDPLSTYLAGRQQPAYAETASQDELRTAAQGEQAWREGRDAELSQSRRAADSLARQRSRGRGWLKGNVPPSESSGRLFPFTESGYSIEMEPGRVIAQDMPNNTDPPDEWAMEPLGYPVTPEDEEKARAARLYNQQLEERYQQRSQGMREIGSTEGPTPFQRAVGESRTKSVADYQADYQARQAQAQRQFPNASSSREAMQMYRRASQIGMRFDPETGEVLEPGVGAFVERAVQSQFEVPENETLEQSRGRALGLEAVSRSAQVGFEGIEGQDNQIKTLLARAKKFIYNSIDEEIKAAAPDSVDARKASQRIQRMAENVVDQVVGQVEGETQGEFARQPGAIARQLRQDALQMKPWRDSEALQSLYDQDETFRSGIDRANGLDSAMRGGGVFSSGDGPVNIEAGGAGFGGGGRGGFGGQRNPYAAIRAWYGLRAFTGVMNMTIGESLGAMANAEDFERNMILSQGGGGLGPISGLMNRARNRGAWAGIAAEQQFGFLADVPNQLFGDVGGQRLYQAGRFAFGIGTAGLVANSLLAMGGMGQIQGLGQLGVGLGAGYGALALTAELTGREGVGELVYDARRYGAQAAGTALALPAYYANQLSQSIGMDNPWAQAMGQVASGVANYLTPTQQFSEAFLDPYRRAGGLGLDVQQTASVGAQLTRMYGDDASFRRVANTPFTFAEALTYRADLTGTDALSLLESSYNYAQSRYATPGEQQRGILEYARMEPSQQFSTDRWLSRSQSLRSTMVQSGFTQQEAYSQLEGVFPNLTEEDLPFAGSAVELASVARRYNVNMSVDRANQIFSGTDLAQRQQLMQFAPMFAQATTGRPYGALNMEALFGTVSGLDTRQIGAASQLYQTVQQYGQPLESVMSYVGDFSRMTPMARGGVLDLYGVSQMNGLGGDLGGIMNVFSGLNPMQQGFAGQLGQQFYGMGMQWDQSLDWASRVAGRMTSPMDLQRQQEVMSLAMNLGVSPEASMVYGMHTTGMTGTQYRDYAGVLRGDQWSLSQLATNRPELGLTPTIDVNTGLNAWQQDIWNLEDYYHTVQRQDQQFGMQQRQQQFAENQAFTFGGNFYNPITGQQQNIQYGTLDINESLFDISVRQQRDNFAYQEQQLALSTRQQRDQMQSNYGQQVTRLGWRVEDWEYGENVSQLSFAWQMEDYDENIRFARGRDRQRLMRQRDRAVISESMRRGHSEDQRDRMDQEREWLDERTEKNKEYFEENTRLQEERLERDKRYFEERTQWQQRQQQLTRQQAELQNHHAQQQIQQAQNMLQAQEEIYQRQTAINRERIQAQAEVEKWLRDLPNLLPDISDAGNSGGGSSYDPGAVGSGTYDPGDTGSGTVTRPPSNRIGVGSPISQGAVEDDRAVNTLDNILGVLRGMASGARSGLNVTIKADDVHQGVDDAMELYNDSYRVFG